MIRLDSIKLKGSLEDVNSFDKSIYKESIMSIGDVSLGTKYETMKQNVKTVGLHKITINESSKKFDKLNDVCFSFSSKILGQNYYEMVNIDTIEQALSEVNKSGLIDIKINQFIDNAEILSCDSTNNLKVNKEVKNYISALNTFRINDKYETTIYRKDKNNGIVFQGKQKSFKERLIFYDKLLDVRKDKLLNSTIGRSKLEKTFRNVLRCEQNTTSFSKIKERFNIPDHKLLSVLNSNAKPNYKLFNKISKKSLDVSLFDGLCNEKMSWRQVKENLGLRYIIEFHHFDIDLITQTMKRFFSNNTRIWTQKQKVKDMMFRMEMEKTPNINTTLDVINEVKALLKVA